MTKLRIEEAIQLQNFRQHLKNIKAGRELHKRKTRKSLLARHLWPDAKEEKALQYMSGLSTGKRPTIKIEWVQIICKECGVDANFLFGLPSKHDGEFERSQMAA